MPFYVVAFQQDEERSHILTEGDDAASIEESLGMIPEFNGKKLQAVHPLPEGVRPALSCIGDDTDASAGLSVGAFRKAVEELFAEGKKFADRQAASLPPFVSASTLVPQHDEEIQKILAKGVPGLRRCTSDISPMALSGAEAHLRLVTTFERGMLSRIDEMKGYPHYFVTAKNGGQLANFVTDASSMSRVTFVATKTELKHPTILVTHRLKPSVQEMLSHPENDVPFDTARFDSFATSLREDGRRLFETHGSALPPRRNPFPIPEAMETDPLSILSSVRKDLKKSGTVVLDCSDIRSVVTELMTEGRNDAWREAYAKGA